MITAQWTGGESERTAQWSFNLSSRTVTAIDDTASDLLSDRPIRPVFTESPVTLTTAPPLAPGVVAFPAMPNAHTGPLPTREQLFDQHAFREGPVKSRQAGRTNSDANRAATSIPLPLTAGRSNPNSDFEPEELVDIDEELAERR